MTTLEVGSVVKNYSGLKKLKIVKFATENLCHKIYISFV